MHLRSVPLSSLHCSCRLWPTTANAKAAVAREVPAGAVLTVPVSQLPSSPTCAGNPPVLHVSTKARRWFVRRSSPRFQSRMRKAPGAQAWPVNRRLGNRWSRRGWKHFCRLMLGMSGLWFANDADEGVALLRVRPARALQRTCGGRPNPSLAAVIGSFSCCALGGAN